MIAAGVARPSAHGHAISRTATACSSACPGSALPRSSQPANVAAAMSITTGTKIDETRSASRWTGAFDPWADSSSRTISDSFVFDADLRDEDHQPAVAVDRGADDLAPGADVDGHRLAGQHREVHPGRALPDDPVGGDLLSGKDHDEFPGRSSSIGTRRSTPSARTVASLAPRSSSVRAASPADDPRTRLEGLAHQDQRDDHRGGVEVVSVRSP